MTVSSPRSQPEPASDFTTTTGRVTLSAGTIHYTDLEPQDRTAHGPPIVFVHGAWVDSSLWSETASMLAARHRCLLPTWPLGSHTEPMRADADLSPLGAASLIAELLKVLGLEGVTLVGNDTGGALCQMVVARHGQRVGRLVLTNCDAFEVFPPRAYRHLALLPKVPGLLAAVAKDMYALPTLARLPGGFGPLARRRIATGTLRRWLRPAAKDAEVRRDLGRLLRSIDPATTLEIAGELGGFPGETLLLWGDADRYFTLDLARRLEAAFGHARLETIPGARTFVSLDEPSLVARAISRFHLEGHSAVRASA